MEPAAKKSKAEDGVLAISDSEYAARKITHSSMFAVDPSSKQLSGAAFEHYRREGYMVVRQLMTSEEAGVLRTEMHRVIDDWYDEFDKTGVEKADWESMVNREESVRHGEQSVRSQQDRYVSVRRLFRMAVQDPYFQRVACKTPQICNIAEEVLGGDIKLLQSMALLKPPGAPEKRWHQDNGYFRLTPSHVMAFWIAIDEATEENGCMHIVPGTHTHGCDDHNSPNGNHKLYSLVDTPRRETVVSVPLKPGDALVFHGELHHFTPPNRSSGPRYALQLHYASGKCRPTVCPKSDANDDKTAAPEPEQDGDQEAGSTAITTASSVDSGNQGDTGFDCDPSVKCVEPQFWYYRKAERLVLGQDYGDPYI